MLNWYRSVSTFRHFDVLQFEFAPLLRRFRTARFLAALIENGRTSKNCRNCFLSGASLTIRLLIRLLYNVWELVNNSKNTYLSACTSNSPTNNSRYWLTKVDKCAPSTTPQRHVNHMEFLGFYGIISIQK